MQFQRLRVSGFKSFVEPTEFRIEPGLTGVVGPNGCGKSNLLEALRWVMGANSAKAMRAEGMDDLIFGGAASRPARNHAEVSLQIDNSERRAPARFNDHAVLEVVRRITRGGGSVYRINGTEARARDVQLLFADASTGANSPAMVRQGQVSELIAAKPANRRRTLEEAAGVAGLHARRQEAHLRLNAAEANLARLDDVVREVEQGLGRLRREARQAETYRRLSAEIRALEGAALYARWAEAEVGWSESCEASAESRLAVEASAREAARANAASLAAAEALKPLREEAMVSAAVLQRLTLEHDRVARDVEQAQAETARLGDDLQRNLADRTREAAIAEDAREALRRIDHEVAELDRATATPDRLPGLAEALGRAEAARAEADRQVEHHAGAAAAETARRADAAARLEQARRGLGLAGEQLGAAKARQARLAQARAAAAQERDTLPDAGPQGELVKTRLEAAVSALAAARRALEAGEGERADAAAAEEQARAAARRADDTLRRLRTEAEGLVQLASVDRGAFPPALDQVTPDPGFEAAVAAAFGEDLQASLDLLAPAFWSKPPPARPQPPTWPPGVTPLAAYVTAPDALAARLRLTALVEAADGPRLQGALPVGGRLVSREGDLWRWDGFTARAAAPGPAAKRLAQKARLAALQAEIGRAGPQAVDAAGAHRSAAQRLQASLEALKALRRAPEAAERDVAAARDLAERQAREAARTEARRLALEETLVRLDTELEEAAAGLAELETAVRDARDVVQDAEAQRSGPAPDQAALISARREQALAREGETHARTAADAERRAVDARRRRRETLQKESDDWTRRAGRAGERIDALEREGARIDTALAAARERPQALEQGRERLEQALFVATRRRTQADETLALALAASEAGERSTRDAEREAALAREAQAAAAARLEAARERLDAAHDQLQATTGLDQHALKQQIATQALAAPRDPAALEAHLRSLQRERDVMGPVNLRAEEAARSHDERLQLMLGERADLTGAIAKLRAGVDALNAEGRERLLAAFAVVNESFKGLFQTLFDGGQAELRLVESDDPLEAGLEIFACPPGKRLASLSLMSGGEQALTACALILAVFLSNPAPVCVLDEVDAPLDDANVDRFCRLLDEMRRRTDTRFIAITHNPVTMSRMDRLFGVTMQERGVSQLVSVDLRQAEAMAGGGPHGLEKHSETYVG